MTTSREKMFDKAYEPLMLQTKLEDIDLYAHRKMEQFPKPEKFRLCSDIKESLAKALHLTMALQKKYYKKNTLQDIDIELEFLRHLVRKSHALRYISTGCLGEWMAHVDEAGRILGGLMRYFAARDSAKQR